MSPAVRSIGPDIAKEMAKLFGDRAKMVPVEIRFARQAGAFVQRIEKAHKQAANSKLVFKTAPLRSPVGRFHAVPETADHSRWCLIH